MTIETSISKILKINECHRWNIDSPISNTHQDKKVRLKKRGQWTEIKRALNIKKRFDDNEKRNGRYMQWLNLENSRFKIRQHWIRYRYCYQAIKYQIYCCEQLFSSFFPGAIESLSPKSHEVKKTEKQNPIDSFRRSQICIICCCVVSSCVSYL